MNVTQVHSRLTRILACFGAAMLAIGLAAVAARPAYADDSRYIVHYVITYHAETPDTRENRDITVSDTSHTFNAEELRDAYEALFPTQDTEYWKGRIAENYEYAYPKERTAEPEEILKVEGEGDHTGQYVQFKAEICDNYYPVTVPAGTGGTASIVSPTADGRYENGKPISLKAEPSTGHAFKQWSYEVEKWEQGGKDVTHQAKFANEKTASTTLELPNESPCVHFRSTQYQYKVTAEFAPITYTVAFDKNSATATGPIMPAQAFTYGSEQKLTANAYVNEGYTFVGWSEEKDGAVKYTDGQSVKDLATEQDATVTLYAQWKAEPVPVPTTYAITIEAPENGVLKSSKSSATEGAQITLTATPSKGYVFSEWNVTDASGESIVVTATTSSTAKTAATQTTGTFTMPASDVTATATFELIPTPDTYTITFDKNAEDATGEMEDQTVTEDVATALNANTFKRVGYTFKEWNTEEDGTGDTYKDKGEITATEDMTLYAQWESHTHAAAPQPEMSTNTSGNLTSRNSEITYIIIQEHIPADATTVRLSFDLNETMEYTMAAEDIKATTGDGTREFNEFTRKLDGQHLEVTVPDAQGTLEDHMFAIEFTAKMRSGANLNPYLNDAKNVAAIPYQGRNEFTYTDGCSNLADSTSEVVKFSVSAPAPNPGTKSPTITTTTTTRTTPRTSSTLAKTADPTSIAAMTAALGTGLAALAAGLSRKRK